MNPWLQQLAQRFHRGRGDMQGGGGGGMGVGPWGNPGAHNGGQGQPLRTSMDQAPWAQPGGWAGIQPGAGANADGDQGQQPMAAPRQLPPNWLQSMQQGGAQQGGPQSAMPQFPGWEQNAQADPRVASIQAQGLQRATAMPQIPDNEDPITGMPKQQYQQFAQQRRGY